MPKNCVVEKSKYINFTIEYEKSWFYKYRHNDQYTKEV